MIRLAGLLALAALIAGCAEKVPLARMPEMAPLPPTSQITVADVRKDREIPVYGLVPSPLGTQTDPALEIALKRALQPMLTAQLQSDAGLTVAVDLRSFEIRGRPSAFTLRATCLLESGLTVGSAGHRQPTRTINTFAKDVETQSILEGTILTHLVWGCLQRHAADIASKVAERPAP